MDKISGFLEQEISVDVHFVSSVATEMHQVMNVFASLGGEMLAHQFLQKHPSRRMPKNNP
jgi:hypothetical protein